MTAPRCVIVVPCYNEADRLQESNVATLIAAADCDVLLVDDGSRDGTPQMLARIAATQPGVRVHTLAKNSGKAEAVRQGLIAALATGAPVVAFADADFATPPTGGGPAGARAVGANSVRWSSVPEST